MQIIIPQISIIITHTYKMYEFNTEEKRLFRQIK